MPFGAETVKSLPVLDRVQADDALQLAFPHYVAHSAGYLYIRVGIAVVAFFSLPWQENSTMITRIGGVFLAVNSFIFCFCISLAVYPPSLLPIPSLLLFVNLSMPLT